jgi:hypothetical protein
MSNQVNEHKIGGQVQPVNTTQLAAWLIGGVPSARLARLVAERGLATLPTQNELRQIESEWGSGWGCEWECE